MNIDDVIALERRNGRGFRQSLRSLYRTERERLGIPSSTPLQFPRKGSIVEHLSRQSAEDKALYKALRIMKKGEAPALRSSASGAGPGTSSTPSSPVTTSTSTAYAISTSTPPTSPTRSTREEKADFQAIQQLSDLHALLLGLLEPDNVTNGVLLDYLRETHKHKEPGSSMPAPRSATPRKELLTRVNKLVYPTEDILVARAQRIIQTHKGSPDAVIDALQASSQKVESEALSMDQTLGQLISAARSSALPTSVVLPHLETIREEVVNNVTRQLRITNAALERAGYPTERSALAEMASASTSQNILNTKHKHSLKKKVKQFVSDNKTELVVGASVLLLTSAAVLYKYRRDVSNYWARKNDESEPFATIPTTYTRELGIPIKTPTTLVVPMITNFLRARLHTRLSNNFNNKVDPFVIGDELDMQQPGGFMEKYSPEHFKLTRKDTNVKDKTKVTSEFNNLVIQYVGQLQTGKGIFHDAAANMVMVVQKMPTSTGNVGRDEVVLRGIGMEEKLYNMLSSLEMWILEILAKVTFEMATEVGTIDVHKRRELVIRHLRQKDFGSSAVDAVLGDVAQQLISFVRKVANINNE
jgi:hypothetical protein